MARWPFKDPNEVLDYGYDWSPILEDGETVVTASQEILPDDDGSLTVDSHTVDPGGTSVTVWLSGGVEGTRYAITLRAVTSLDRTYDETVYLRVKTR